ncbi:NAD(P)H-binding protein [Streptomyces sp. bgisy100]|uniref:NAD(P)H-binding protein n=1 Tax=Streptomyces sp. bgisy100 TaxID=3413783 RepID=UPI003D703B43
MTEHPILVLGATGSTGRRVTARLRAAGQPVRAASRSSGTPFDWTDPGTWKPVVAGARRMYLMAPDGVPVDASFVACAVDEGVERIVLLSSRGIELMGDERLMAAERTVRESGAAWTVVRPDWFNQNFDEGFLREAVRAGEVTLPLGDVRQVFVDADDIAAVAVAALTEDGHSGQTYEVTGPRALSFAEAAETIARVSGRPVRFRGATADFIAAQEALGLSRDDAEAVAEAFAALRDAGDGRTDDAVLRVTGRPPKDFESYAAEAAAQGAWRD